MLTILLWLVFALTPAQTVAVEVVYATPAGEVLRVVGAQETVSLHDSEGHVIDRAQTDSDGRVVFDLPLAGQPYSVSATAFWGLCEDVAFMHDQEVTVRCTFLGFRIRIPFLSRD